MRAKHQGRWSRIETCFLQTCILLTRGAQGRLETEVCDSLDWEIAGMVTSVHVPWHVPNQARPYLFLPCLSISQSHQACSRKHELYLGVSRIRGWGMWVWGHVMSL